MSFFIEDGTGSGVKAKVDDKNRLATVSFNENIEEHFTAIESGFNINTGDISLTSGNESALLYFKNTGLKDIWIKQLIYLVGASTGGSGEYRVSVYKNPTGGTLVSAGTSFSAVNRDFGSNASLDGTLLKGSEGSTITGGSIALESLLVDQGRHSIDPGLIILRPGNSIAISLTPQSGNTAQTVQLAMATYINTEGL